MWLGSLTSFIGVGINSTRQLLLAAHQTMFTTDSYIHVADQPWKRRGKKKVNIIISLVVGLLCDIISL